MTEEGKQASFSTDPVSRGRRSKDNDIRLASVSLFFTHGFNAVGIRQIGNETALNAATLYHYYPSKLAILESIMEDTNRLVLDAARYALSGATDPATRISKVAASLGAAQVSNPQTCYIVDNELRAIDRGGSQGERILELRREYEDLWRTEIAEGHRAGYLQCDDEDVARLSALGLLSATSMWFRPNRVMSAKEACVRVTRLVERLLGAKESAPEGDLLESLDFVRWPWEPPPGRKASTFPSYARILLD